MHSAGVRICSATYLFLEKIFRVWLVRSGKTGLRIDVVVSLMEMVSASAIEQKSVR